MTAGSGDGKGSLLAARGLAAPPSDGPLTPSVDPWQQLRPGETVLCTSQATFGERHGALATLAEGHDPDEPGVLVLTDRRLLFLIQGNARLILTRHDTLSWTVVPGPGGRADLWVLTPVGPVALYGVSPAVERVVADGNVAAPHAPGSVVAAAGPTAARAVAARAGRAAREHWASVAACVAAIVWTASLASADPDEVGDAGIVSALSPAAFLALALLCATFGAALARGRSAGPRLGVQLAALIFMLYGAPSLISDVPSFNVTWRHAGIADYISEHGSVDAGINAYFNWPGFFVLAALAKDLAGLDSTIELARWAPLAFNLLYLAPLLLIARAASDDPRFPWVAAWIFYLANWAYQEYLSPQGLTFLLYLALAGILLSWFRARDPSAANQAAPPATESRPAQQVALQGVCFLILLAAVPSHQLTPLAMLAAAAALVALRASSFKRLPAIALVLIVAWTVFAAGPYLSGHLDALTDDVGQLSETLSSSVGERVDGSDAHVLVTRMRLVTTGLLWVLAAVAMVRLWRGRARRWLPHGVLALAPFALVPLQAYGGEIVIRAYLFGLPFVAVLVASLFPLRPSPRRGVAALALMSALLLVALLFTRYGNERINLFTPGEVGVVERLYERAPPGAVLVAPNPQLPWRAEDAGVYREKTLDAELAGAAEPGPGGLATRVKRVIEGFSPAAGYVVITRNTREYEEVFGAAEWGTIAALERALEASPRFANVHQDPDGEIFALEQRRAGGEGS